MLHLPVLRWGQPYTSMDVDEVVHFATGEPIAKVSRANGGLIQRDMRKAERAREALRDIPIAELIARVSRAGAGHDTTPTAMVTVVSVEPNTATSTSSSTKFGRVWNASVIRISTLSTQPP